MDDWGREWELEQGEGWGEGKMWWGKGKKKPPCKRAEKSKL